jgi:hypothetical protein
VCVCARARVCACVRLCIIMHNVITQKTTVQILPTVKASNLNISNSQCFIYLLVLQLLFENS